MSENIGKFYDVNVDIDENVPKGTILLLNEKHMVFTPVVVNTRSRSRWQRTKDWVKKLFKLA